MPNYDEKTGIRYGVISPNNISSFALDDIYQNGTDPHYENAKQELLDDIKVLCENHGLRFEHINTDSFEDEFNDHFESCGDGQMDYSDNEYDLHVSGDNFGIFVMRSPYYTYCRKCSPCAPGAGDLNNPIDKESFESFLIAGAPQVQGQVIAYCLGPEWFDKDNDQYSRKIPYRVFRVDNDQEVV